MKSKKSIFLLTCSILSLITSIILLVLKINDYLIILSILTALFIIWTIIEIAIDNSNPSILYENKVNRIIRTYDPKISTLENFSKLKIKKIYIIKELEDLIEINEQKGRKLYYIKSLRCTAIYLVDKDQLDIYLIKMYEEEKTAFEKELKKIKLNTKKTETTKVKESSKEITKKKENTKTKDSSKETTKKNTKKKTSK